MLVFANRKQEEEVPWQIKESLVGAGCSYSVVFCSAGPPGFVNLRGQEASWFRNLCCLLARFFFCQTGGMQFYLDHGQVIDLNPHDILLLSAGACIQRIQSAAPAPAAFE